MFISLIPVSYASSFTDLESHWATEYVEHVVSEGLFNGISAELFSPNTTMTRGMFVTVLGRVEGIDLAHWSQASLVLPFTDVAPDAYYTPYIRWALCKNIVSGITATTFAPDVPITREQMSKLAAYYIEKMGHSLKAPFDDNELPPDFFSPVSEEAPAEESTIEFADEEQISPWAKDSVHTLCDAGILTGVNNPDGSVSFRPQATATRAECAAVFSRILKTLHKNPTTLIENITVHLDVFELYLQVGEMYPLFATASEEGTPLTWLSSDPQVAEVDENGLVTCNEVGTAVITVYTTSGYYNTCYVYCSSAAYPPAKEYPLENMSTVEKALYVFGEALSGDLRGYYKSRSEAESNLVYVNVRTWDINKKGEKYTRNWDLRVHKNLAEAVVEIFEEIYNGPEQFPIHQLYCYNWGSGTSEHSMGTAIDINWDENYYCYPDGTAITGNYWKPGEDPYSIIPDGDVVTAFAHYGYRWGIYWNSGKKDYMHFSFFGT
ncbi:MAG: S-layer homology domain-containing protein [Oscillospiraceae bacterium]|nr:S-layer homology domain-containing protein [Oscillospiraceae bacterium]